MPAPELTWSVVTTSKGPAEITIAFAAHHVAQGAAMVYVFLDDPDDPVAAELKAMGRTRVVRCTPKYWQSSELGARPPEFHDRQTFNANSVLGQARGDWILSADTNEFLFIARPLGEQVAEMEPGQTWLRIPQIERIWLDRQPMTHVLQGLFRYPIQPTDSLIDRVYPKDTAQFLHAGVAGEARGRPLVPNVAGPVLGYRTLEPGSSEAPQQPKVATGMALLRFEGFTALDWAAETLRLAERPDAELGYLRMARRRQVAHVRDTCSDLHEVLEFHRKLFTIDQRQAKGLADARRLIASPVDLLAPVSSKSERASALLTPRSFDEVLGKEAAALLMRKLKGPKQESPAA